MFDQDNFPKATNSLFPPSPPHSSNHSQISLKMMMNEEQEQQEIPGSSASVMEEDNNEAILKDLADFILQSRAYSPRTPPFSPQNMFFLNSEQQHPYQQQQQEEEQQSLMDFELYDLIEASPDSDYQLFPTLPNSSSS